MEEWRDYGRWAGAGGGRGRVTASVCIYIYIYICQLQSDKQTRSCFTHTQFMTRKKVPRKVDIFLPSSDSQIITVRLNVAL